MRVVHKYPITSIAEGAFPIEMEVGARILYVGHHEGNLTLWAEVDPKARTETRTFAVVPTGRPCPPEGSHVDSTRIGGFVWHVYETT